MLSQNTNVYMIRSVNINLHIRKTNHIYRRNNRTSQKLYTNTNIIRTTNNRKRLTTITQSSMGIVEYSEIIGRGLILFVFFASSLNWLHYRHLRQQIEDENEKVNNKNNNKNNK